MKKYTKIFIISSIFILFLNIGYLKAFASSYSFVKTNNLLLSTNPSNAKETLTFSSKSDCETAKGKIDTKYYSASDCKEVLLEESATKIEVYNYEVVMKESGKVPELYGFKNEKDCNNNRDNFLKSDIYLKNKDVYLSVGLCKPTKDISNDGVVNVNPKTGTETSNIYTLLAPIGKITTMNSTTGGCSDTDDTCIGNNIGKYLNYIFKFIIGLCAALAVVMLIINGITYMGDESIFTKVESKKKMLGAISGLIIALGAWTLLNTINPDLTGSKGVNIDTANIEVETTPLTQNDPFTSGTITTGCPSGIVMANTVNGNIPICKSMESFLISMIAKAKTEGINLFGYGYRSKEKQEALRATNCGGVAYVNVATAKCNPATAMPGKSNHENGLAVDFQCDGTTIKSTTNKCYIWLSTNAGTYGFKNLKSEPWHWSTNGR